MAGSGLVSAYSICSDKVRADDPDRFFASLFWPAPARPHAHAVLAFNVEIAKIPGVVSEPMLGEIRLQWWRDAIDRDEPAGNPIAEALLDTTARFNLDKARWLALLEARAFDLYQDPMPSQAALDAYVRDTSSTPFDAVARVLAPGRLPPACVDAAGRAYARTGLLRGLPWQVMRGQLFIPLDVLAKFQLPPEHVLAHRNSPALRLVLGAMRAAARVDLATMHQGLVTAAPAARAACIPASLCDPLLKVMERPSLDPFETPVDIPRWRRQWILWRAARAVPRSPPSGRPGAIVQ